MILKGINLSKGRTKRSWSGNSFYQSKAWKQYSKEYLIINPICVVCGKEAKIVDHIQPIKQGGSTWNPNNHQALCRSCHAKKTGSDNEYNGIPRY